MLCLSTSLLAGGGALALLGPLPVMRARKVAVGANTRASTLEYLLRFLTTGEAAGRASCEGAAVSGQCDC